MNSVPFASRLLRSSGAATISQVWRMGVTLVTHMALRRLLGQDAIGLFVWAEFVFLLVSQLRDLGLPAQLVRDPARPYGALLAVELGWGTLFATAVFLASPWIALTGGGGSTLTRLTQLFCLFLFFDGLSKVPLTYFEAELQVQRALLPELARNLAYCVLSVVLAIAGWGVWSMVTAHVAATALFAATLWWRAWGRMPLRRPRWAEMAPLIRHSLPLMLMSFLLLGIDRVDYLIVQLRFGEVVNGLYSGALYVAVLLTLAVELPLRRALYAGFVAVRDDPRRFFETYRLSTLLLLGVMVPFALAVAVNAELGIRLLWGTTHDYTAAAAFLPLLALSPLVQPFARCAEDVLLTLHRERLLIAGSAITLASIAIAGVLLTSRYGVVGMAWAKLLPLGSILISWAVARIDPAAFWRLARELVELYLIPLPLFLPLLLIPNLWWRSGATVVAAAATLGYYLWRHGEAFRRFVQDDPAV